MSSSPTISRGAGSLFGRDSELEVIERWCALAAGGAARTGVLVGPQGVGKSALLEVASEQRRRRGDRVLTASCSTGAGVPYLPLLAALGPLLDHVDGTHRPDLSGEDLAALRHLVDPPSRSATDDAARRALDAPLYQAVTRLVLGAARARPTVLVLDDLHEIDDASIVLLEHLLAAARHGALAPTPFLFLTAVRPGAGDRMTRRRIDRLRRSEGSAELAIGGLDELGMNDLLCALGDGRPTRRLLHIICERSSGNPLLASLLWAHLRDQGAVELRGELVQLVDPSAPMLARVDLDDIVDARLDLLTPQCRELLGVASVLGVRGDLDELGAVADLRADEVDGLLEQAEELGVVGTSATEYWFDHPLLAAACARHRSPRRRQADHLRAAREVERRHGRSAAMRAASHLQAAGSLAGIEERRRVGLAAADQAWDLGAWGAAANAFDLALADDVVDGWPELQRAHLHRRAAEVAIAHQDADACERHATAAIELARGLGATDLWGRAVASLLRGRVRIASVGSEVVDQVAEPFLDASGDDTAETTAVVHGLLSEMRFTALDFDRGLAHAVQARDHARRSGSPDVEAFACFVEGLQRQGAFDLEASDACFERGASMDGRPDDVARWCRARLATNTWFRGALAAAERAVSDAQAEAASFQDWAELALMSAWSAAVAGAQGRWSEAEDRATRALQLYRRTDYEFAAVVAHPSLVVARSVRGDLSGALSAVEEWTRRTGSRLGAQLETLAIAIGGTPDQLDAHLDAHPWRSPRPGPISLRNASSYLTQVELGLAAGRPELAAGAAGPVATMHARGLRFVPGSVALVSRLAAVAHDAAGDAESARAWFHVAATEAVECGASAEVARVDLDFAGHLAHHGDAAERRGVDHLFSRAAATFNEMGMLPMLRRAEQGLGSIGRTSSSRSVRTILFTDLVESTQLNVAIGNEEFVSLLRAHDRIARRLLREHDGVQFKHTGDGLAAWFASAGRAVQAALAMQEEMEGLLHAESGQRVRIRCGLATGEPIEDAGDLFGISVIRAARVCAAAGAGEVLVAGEVPAMAVHSALEFDDAGARSLKGLPGVTEVFRARRGASAHGAVDRT